MAFVHSKIWPAYLTALAAFSLLFAGYDLGRESFWFDETFSVNAARMSFSDRWDLAWQVDPHMALWHGFLSIWFAIHDGGEFWSRLPSLIAGTACVVTTAEVARRLFNQRVGMMAGIILSLSTALLSFQQEARPYTLAAFLTTASILLLLILKDKPSRKKAALTGAVIALSLYAHPFTALAFIAILPAYIIISRSIISKGILASAIATFAIAASPFIALFLANKDSDNLSWVPDFSSEVVWNCAHFIAGTNSRVIVIAALVLIIIGFALAMRTERSGAAIAYSWLVGMPLIAFAIDNIEPMLVERYLIPAVPAFAIAVAMSIDVIVRQIRINMVQPVVFVALALFMVVYASGDHRTQFKIHNNWRDAFAAISENAKPSDALMSNHFPAVSVYYGQRSPNTKDMMLIETGKPISQSIRDAEFKTTPISDEEMTTQLKEAQNTIWLISVIDAWEDYIEPYLTDVEESRIVPFDNFGAIRVERLEPASNN